MIMDNCSRRQKQFLPIPETQKAGQYLTRRCHLMTRKTGNILLGTGYPCLMKTGNRKREFGKGKERNTSGRKSTSLRTTGTTGRMRNCGEHPGHIIAIITWKKRNRSTTVHMRGRDWTGRQRSTKALRPGRWRKKAKRLNAVRSIGK